MSFEEIVFWVVIITIFFLGTYSLLNGAFEVIKKICEYCGAIICKTILWPWKRWRIHKNAKQTEQEWQKYIDLYRTEIITALMKTAHQEMFGERYTTEQVLAGAAAGAEIMRKAGYSTEDIREDKEERTWQDQIMGRFMRQI